MASIMLVLIMAMVGFVVWTMRKGRDDGPRRAFDPTTTDPEELRRVTEAVSRVIAAPPSQHEVAVQTLEAVRADSAGARDLKESCVNTYRSTIHATQLFEQIRGLIGDGDGGQLRPDQMPDGGMARAAELQREMAEQIELAHQSTDRCMDLYTAAVRTMGIAPAQRYSGH